MSKSGAAIAYEYGEQLAFSDLIDISTRAAKKPGTLRYIDLFCGIGGIRLGMDKAGFSCVFSCDINA